MKRLDMQLDGKPIIVFASEPGEPSERFLKARKRINIDKMRESGLGFPDGEERCLLTGDPVRAEDGIYLITCCHHAFPAGCVSQPAADNLGWESLFETLKRNWAEAQTYKHWFV